MDTFDRNWQAFRASIVTARTRRPVMDRKAIEALRAKDAQVVKDAEVDHSAYLSDTYFNRPEGHKPQVK